MYMESLRKLYRIGCGPSSSHTIGPQNASKYILSRYSNANFFNVTLYGSLALTGKGHLTDRVILETLGKDRTHINFDFLSKVDHPNTFYIEVYFNKKLIGKHKFVSVGGGTIIIDDVNNETICQVYPFSSFKEIKDYCIKENIGLEEVVYRFEDKNIKEYLNNIYEVMLRAINRGLNSDGILPGGLKVERKAKILKIEKTNESLDLKRTRMVSSFAYAVSEENACGGEIVTAPTCGACGVLPSVLYYLEIVNNYSRDKIINALAIASIIGNVIKKNACISGAYAGCQSEIGSACSMAAAACSYLLGSSIDEIEYASEIAMEHYLGLTCDPIKGLVQIPCIERNAVSALRALDAATLASFISNSRKISFDTVVKTMYETGKDLSQDYKETSKAGLAINYKE